MTEVPAGWYDDGQGGQRYWDGTQWTEHTAPGSSSVAAAQAAGSPTSEVWSGSAAGPVAAGGQAGHAFAPQAPSAQASPAHAPSRKGLLIGAGAVVLALAIGGTVFALAGGDGGSGSGGLGSGPDPASLISKDCTKADYSGDIEKWTADCVQLRWNIVVHEDGTVVADQVVYGNAEALLRANGWDGTGSVADAVAAEFGSSDVDVEEVLDGPLGTGHVRDYMTADQAAALWGNHDEVRGHVVVERQVSAGTERDGWIGDWSIESGDGISLQLDTDPYVGLPAGSVAVTVTLPGEVIDTNGTVKGKTVTWTSLDDGVYVTFEGDSTAP